MKTIFFAAMISCLVISCTKDKLENAMLPTPQDNLHYTGVILDDPSLIEKVGYYTVDNNLKNRALPSVDLSGKMPAVGNQGSQNSCIGWAVGYYCKTYQEVREKGWNANENIYSPSWIYNQINGGRDNGAAMPDAMDLLVGNGCDFRDNFPYSPSRFTTRPNDGSRVNAAHYKSYDWQYLKKNTADFKALLKSSQVFIISIPVYPDFDNLSPTNEVYDDWSGKKRGLDHTVCVVGYDDSKKAFKFVNSWGTGWGLNGYGWIAYNRISHIDNAYILIDKTNSYDTKYLIGDLDGDKIQDIFTANGYGFYVSWRGASGLKKINSSAITTNNLKLGDFNGDGKSDVFYPNGSEWKVSYSGTSGWTKINGSAITLSNLDLGDFNGDGKSDVFYPNGSEWKVSYSGTGGWTKINGSAISMGSFKLGDFNGDGKSDVFYPNGSEWKISYSGTGGWTKINGSAITLSNLELGDFNGDGKSDVFYPNGNEWKVSYSGRGKWTKINGSSTTMKNLDLGDFNGDKKCDIFYPSASFWKVSWSGTSGWDAL